MAGLSRKHSKNYLVAKRTHLLQIYQNAIRNKGDMATQSSTKITHRLRIQITTREAIPYEYRASHTPDATKRSSALLSRPTDVPSCLSRTNRYHVRALEHIRCPRYTPSYQRHRSRAL